jgi:hypothetical protein
VSANTEADVTIAIVSIRTERSEIEKQEFDLLDRGMKRFLSGPKKKPMGHAANFFCYPGSRTGSTVGGHSNSRRRIGVFPAKARQERTLIYSGI